MSEQQRQEEIAERIAQAARDRGMQIAVAESLTGGLLSNRLAAASKASEWYRGAVVAYASEVKYDLLGVPKGPVVSAEAAEAMATGVCKLMSANIAVAVTGAGGPDPQDGQPPGTAFISIHCDGASHTHEIHVDGDDPSDIVLKVCTAALEMLADQVA
jgi:nicotinamide-nucleotide amidase